ncbi:OmpH family outer membrane protein [Luteolibacter arcticus]|uniref:OmpH family outer membrane protein n=1 Tax=Luteolibacter arcticus TaxID=1581411 RepID=A0ABT3GR32_9BACT|nr:OmpH family outer membrane protein [Luteolibacter arcticus]MCW1925967.1 OmpH family outer membrane protein [Luteolibacter arcticus]
MKLTLRSLVALSLAIGGISAAQESTRLKIATVDMQALFQEFNPTKDAKANFEVEQKNVGKQFDDRRARLSEMKQELDTLQKQLGDPSIADAKKQALFTDRQVKQQQWEALQREAEEFGKRKQRAMQEQMTLRMKDILERIRTKVQKHAETEGYDYVLDKTGASTSQVPVLLYTKDATDITESLLKTINEGLPAPAPAPVEEKK